jgi:hypothetical protein
MTADDQHVRSLPNSGNDLSSHEPAPRRRHGPAQHITQGNHSDSPVLVNTSSGSRTLQHVADSDDEDSSDDGGQQLLSSAARSSSRSQTRQHAADSGPAYELAFDGIEAADGQPSGASASGSGALNKLLRRHLPGLALFWDGITPELVAVSMGEVTHCTSTRHSGVLRTSRPLA